MTRRVIFACLALALIAAPASAQDDNCPKKDVVFVPTPQEVVDEMLKVANVKSGDVVYDLGSGDGRIPITAAKVHGARGVGIDICDIRIEEATANLKAAGVGDKVKFLKADMFQTDIKEATVVTMYLLPTLNVRLIPKLNKELKPGTRIVSHSFDMSSDGVTRPPTVTRTVNGRMVYMWVTPILPEPAQSAPSAGSGR